MSGIYDFSQDSEKVRWLKTAFPPHARAMLERWRNQDEKMIGKTKAQEKMMYLIKQAKEES